MKNIFNSQCWPDNVPHRVGVTLLPYVLPVTSNVSVQIPVEAMLVSNVSKSNRKEHISEMFRKNHVNYN